MILVITFYIISFLFISFKILYKNLFNINKKLILFLIEFNTYNFMKKTYPTVIITIYGTFLILNLFLNFNSIFLNLSISFFEIFCPKETYCAGTQKITQLSDYEVKKYYSYKSNFGFLYKTQLEKKFGTNLNLYIKNSSFINLSKFNFDCILGQKSIFNDHKSVFKTMQGLLGEFSAIKYYNSKIITELLKSTDYQIDLIKEGSFGKIILDLKTANSFKLHSIFLNYEKFGQKNFNDIANIVIVKKKVPDLILDNILGFLVTERSEFRDITSVANLEIYKLYEKSILDILIFLKIINSKLDLANIYINQNLDGNIKLSLLKSILTLPTDLEINKEKIEYDFKSISSEKEKLLQKEPLINSMVQDINLVFFKNLKKDNSMIQDILNEKKGMILDFDQIDAYSKTNPEYFNQKIFKKVELAKQNSLKRPYEN